MSLCPHGKFVSSCPKCVSEMIDDPMGEPQEEGKLKPCACNADINETFRVQVLWRGGRNDVAVGFCARCLEVASFTFQQPFSQKEFDKQAREAWNNK